MYANVVPIRFAGSANVGDAHGMDCCVHYAHESNPPGPRPPVDMSGDDWVNEDLGDGMPTPVEKSTPTRSLVFAIAQTTAMLVGVNICVRFAHWRIS